jgi:acetyltransferase EpsM
MEERQRRLLILGTRTLAIEIADLASEIPGVEVAGFVENENRERCRDTLEGLPIHWVDELARMKDTHVAIGGLATTHRSRFIEQAAEWGVQFATLVHPRARISGKASLGEGAFVSAGSIISAHCVLGPHVFVNRGALIGHHTEIGRFATIQPGVNIAGRCRIGEHAYVGMSAVVVDSITIGAYSFIGAGSLVAKDISDHVEAVGVPARVIRRNFEGK